MFFVKHDVKAKYQCVQKGTALTIAMFADGFFVTFCSTLFFYKKWKTLYHRVSLCMHCVFFVLLIAKNLLSTKWVNILRLCVFWIWVLDSVLRTVRNWLDLLFIILIQMHFNYCDWAHNFFPILSFLEGCCLWVFYFVMFCLKLELLSKTF
jgi:hypothetical protein